MNTPDAVGVPAWTPCSESSRRRSDPLWGTAGRGERWFLIEVAAGWGRHALLDPPFDPALGRRLVSRIEGEGIRPLAIRRPGRRGATRRWRWAAIDSRAGCESISWGEADDPRDLLETPLDGSTGTPSHRPLFAVCTHGRHDRCCAVHGRRAAQQLAAAFPDETWECSHLGGDRFAATMVMFPHGLAYGRVDDADVTELARAYLAGRVDEARLRGRTSFSHPVQAAQHFARVQFGDDRVDAYLPEADAAEADVHRVQLRDGEHLVTVEMAGALSENLLTTCSATHPTRVREWRLLGIRREVRPGPSLRRGGAAAE